MKTYNIPFFPRQAPYACCHVPPRVMNNGSLHCSKHEGGKNCEVGVVVVAMLAHLGQRIVVGDACLPVAEHFHAELGPDAHLEAAAVVERLVFCRGRNDVNDFFPSIVVNEGGVGCFRMSAKSDGHVRPGFDKQ